MFHFDQNLTPKFGILFVLQSSLSVLLDTPSKLISKLPFRRRSSDLQSPTVVVPYDDENSRATVFVSISESEAGEMPSEVEVVHVRRGPKARKRDGRTRSSTKSSDDHTVAAAAAEPETPESGYRSVLDDPMPSHSVKVDQEQHGYGSEECAANIVSQCDVTPSGACAPVACTSYDCSVGISIADETSDSSTLTCCHDIASLPLGDASGLPDELHLRATESVAVEARLRTPSPQVVLSSSVRNISEDDLLKSILDDHCRSVGAVSLSHENLTDESHANVDSSRTVSLASSSLKETNEFAFVHSKVAVEECSRYSDAVEEGEKQDSCNVSVSPSPGVLNTLPVSFQAPVDEEEMSIYDDAGHDKHGRLSNADEPLGVANVNKDVAVSIFDESTSEKARDRGSPFEPPSPLRGLHPSSSNCRISRTNSELLDSFETGSRQSPTPSLLSCMSVDPLVHQMEIR